MEQYQVTGMSCAACSARVEKAVSGVPGVSACSVNLLTNSMTIEGNASSADIISAVEKAGYGATPQNQDTESHTSSAQKEEQAETKTVSVLRNRLIASLVFLLMLMYVSMGHVMWQWPLPAVLAENPMSIGLIQLLLSAIVMVINQRFFISGFRGLLHKAPNMDTLVSLGASASFIYSTYALFAMSGELLAGNVNNAHHYLHELYFESAAMILALITLGKMLEARSKGKTTDALRSLLDLAPKTAIVIKDGAESEIPIDRLRVGDVFAVRPGGSIPADGIIRSGHSAVNESALTGESIPVDKKEGDFVSAATINQSGYIECEATKVGADTALSQIIKMVSDASASKAPIAKIADRVSGIFVPVVMIIALLTLVVWLALGQSVGFALARAISVLVISCPCALGLATPVAIMVASGVGAKNGILFKTAASLEEAGKTQIVALDKTGTITAGKPSVTDVLPADGVTAQALLELAASLEKNSEHPLAVAVMEYAAKNNTTIMDVTDFTALPGNGLSAVSAGKVLCGGNLKFIQTQTNLPETAIASAEQLADQGKTPLFFATGGQYTGIIAVADVIKEDSPAAIAELKKMGIRVVMLTGDNERTAKAMAARAGVDEVIAGVLPEGKESVIRSLQKEGKTAMVGDGINDAPALTRADIGIAIGAGTDIAIDSADIVLMKSDLTDVPAAIRLSRATLKNIRENLFWAFFYNTIGIPLAAGVFIFGLGWTLNPMFGAAAMSLSSFCVVSNALRLNFFTVNTKQKGTKKMKKTMKIEGMMCPHCEGRVKQYLEALAQVESAEVSHQTGTAVVTLTSELADDTLRATVEGQGYKVLSIE